MFINYQRCFFKKICTLKSNKYVKKYGLSINFILAVEQGAKVVVFDIEGMYTVYLCDKNIYFGLHNLYSFCYTRTFFSFFYYLL